MSQSDTTEAWRRSNTITDWEFSEVGKLLCNMEPRDLALTVVRLQGEIEVYQMLRATEPTYKGTNDAAT